LRTGACAAGARPWRAPGPGWCGRTAVHDCPSWAPCICGHLGRLATRDDVSVHQQYMADIEASAREALAPVDPVPFYMRYGENVWAGVRAHLDTVTERAAASIIAKYTVSDRIRAGQTRRRSRRR
jgi:hypothetical protein